MYFTRFLLGLACSTMLAYIYLSRNKCYYHDALHSTPILQTDLPHANQTKMNPVLRLIVEAKAKHSHVCLNMPSGSPLRDGWKVVAYFRGKEDWLPFGQRWTSQAGQDRTIVDIFGGKKNGYFVDLASHDAVYISNTLTLEQEFGWDGLCIEANPRFLPGLLQRRCRVAVAVAGADTGQRMPFYAPDWDYKTAGLGGLVGDEFDNKQVLKKKHIKNITTVGIEKIFNDFSVPNVIDYLSLDIEGAEYFVFKKFPWDRYTFLTITVERPQLLAKILTDKGYVYVKDHGNFGDQLFVHQSIPNLKDLLVRHQKGLG